MRILRKKLPVLFVFMLVLMFMAAQMPHAQIPAGAVLSSDNAIDPLSSCGILCPICCECPSDVNCGCCDTDTECSCVAWVPDCDCDIMPMPCNCQTDLLPSPDETRLAFIIGRRGEEMHPTSPLIRSEIAAMFFRIMSHNARSHFFLQSGGTNNFSDVDAQWFNNSLSTLVAAGIWDDSDGGDFRPGEHITIAEFLQATSNFMGVALDDLYAFYPHTWNGVRPQDRTILRAEAVAILLYMRGFTLDEYIPQALRDEMHTFPGNDDENTWYYWYMQAATHSHCFTIHPNGDIAWVHLLDSYSYEINELWVFSGTMQGAEGLAEFNAMVASILAGCHLGGIHSYPCEHCDDSGIVYRCRCFSNPDGCRCGSYDGECPCVCCECVCVCEFDLTVTVIDPDGNPVPDVNVTVTDSEGNEHTGVTGEDGTVVFPDFPAGEYTVVASHPDRPYSGTTAGDMPSDAPGEAEVRLRPSTEPPSGDLTVTVVDEDGEPVEGANVTVTDSEGDEHTGVTGEDGTVVFPDFPAGEYEVVVTHPNFPDGGSGYGDMPEEDDDEITITLRPPSDEPGNDLTVIVEDEDEEPIENANVRVYVYVPGEEGEDGTWEYAESGYTDEYGRIVFPDFPAGDYRVVVTHPDFDDPNDTYGEMPEGEDSEITITLAAPDDDTFNLTVTVVDNNGVLIPGATVVVTDSNNVSRTGVTGANGTIVFSNFPAGNYSILATHPDFPNSGVGGGTMPEDAHGTATVTLIRPPTTWSPGPGPGSGPGIIFPPLTGDNVTVTFLWNYPRVGDGVYHRSTVRRGNTASAPPLPLREGYVFQGWYLDQSGQNRFNFNSTINENINLYARWTAVRVDWNPIHYSYLIGFPDGTIRPSYNITRAEVATIFFRLISDNYRSQIWSQNNPFSDVELENWFNNAVSTMANDGMLRGYEDGTFRPNVSITRAEVATLISRFVDLQHSGANVFSDINGHWASASINAVASISWVQGYEDGTFRPDLPITRAEMATIVNRVLNRIPETADDLLPGMIIWPDNMDVVAWYYVAIQEATNSNYYARRDNSVFKYWVQLLPARVWTVLERPYSQPGDIL